jgi:hypothetical protein
MLAATAYCQRKFAMAVAEQYIALVAVDDRTVPFRWGVTTDQLFAAEKHNAQVLARFMSGVVKVLPADLEDAWVMALPEPYRGDCERDLARRRGLLTVRCPDAADFGGPVGLAVLAREFGQLVEAAAPALADNRLDAADIPHARRILNESDDLLGAVACLRQQVSELLQPNGGK